MWRNPLFFNLQVPGRMGLLITLYLITFNVYGSVSANMAPPERGFSYVELWMAGMQIPILGAVIEYSTILGLRKYSFKNEIETTKVYNMQAEDASKMKLRWDKKVDMASFVLSLTYFLIFCIFYWLI